MNLKDTLVEAKNLILTGGWIRGDLGSEETGYCLFGALDAASDMEIEMFLDSTNVVKETLRGRGSVTHITAWNDAPHRTKQDVLDLLDEAASRA